MRSKSQVRCPRRFRYGESLEAKLMLAGDLVAHWRADDLNATLDDQAGVMNWVDQVASVDAVAHGQPTLVKSALGGRSAVRFSTEAGAEGFTIGPTASPMRNADDFTIVVAFATDSQNLVGARGHWFESSGLVDGNAQGFGNDWGVSINAAGTIATGLGGGFGSTPTTIHSSATGLNDGQLHVVAVTRQQASVSLYVDNSLSASTLSGSAADRSPLGMALGMTFTESNRAGFEGDIAEVRIYNGQLTEAELTAVHDEVDGYYRNALPVAVADSYTFVEDASAFDIFVPASQGVLANDTDADGDRLTASLIETTQNGELTLNENGSFVYDSDPDFFGTDSFTYVAHDFRPSSPVTVTINVTAQYDPAIAAADQYKLLSGSVLTVDAGNGLLMNDANPDQADLQVEIVAPVTAGALQLNPEGGFVYDPQGFAGEATFEYRILDGTSPSNSATVSLIVNTPPEAQDDSYALSEDAPLVIDADSGVRANDHDAEGDELAVTLISGPSHGTVSLAVDGSFQFDPDADYFGVDQFTYRLNDGEDDSDLGTVMLNIAPVNDPPVAADDSYFTLADVGLTVPANGGVLHNDGDQEGGTLTAELVQTVDQGSLTLNADGSFTYVPPAGFTGTAGFTYRANDGQDVSSPTSVQIAINSLEEQRQIVINEVHVDPDIETERVEFVELYNRGTTTIDLTNWRLREAIDYVFPPGSSVPPGGYLVVSQNPQGHADKFAHTALGPWEGRLSNEGETIELWNAAESVIDELTYGLGFPWPTVGDVPGPSMQLINPGLENDVAGHWQSAPPTPGDVNSMVVDNAPPVMHQIHHGPEQPRSGQTVTITALVSDTDGLDQVNLAYQQVDPGDYITQSDDRFLTQWTTIAMHDDGQNGDVSPGDGVYTAVLPTELQQHRRLVRYRITAIDALGVSRTAPYDDDPQPNFAYFVYDQIPSWTGAAQPGDSPAVTYSSELLESVPVYHLITTHANHVDSQFIADSERRSAYSGSDYLWEGTLVYDGVVYDHINFRSRGGVWRYAMGKNMWKFDFERGHSFQARDDYGVSYDVPWDKLNFSSIIQQGNFLHRGEQGLFESVGFKLFDLAGTESPETHYVHFRIIADANEQGEDQYNGDFQGLYLAVEHPSGNFLDQHDMPDGNFYKIENYAPESTVNQSPTQVDDASDVRDFIDEFRGNRQPGVEWWQQNLDLERYYGYQAISQAIHHYDTAFGKNYYYYHNPDTDKWQIHPWDLDLTWADNMYGNENHEFNVKVARNPDFNNYTNPANIELNNRLNAEYQNVVREIMDLLYNPEQTGMLIDQVASIIYQPGEVSLVDADRAMWDYNPINATSSRYTDNSKNATQYHFYDRADTNDFAGMIQLMKDYVEDRGDWMMRRLLTNEANIPDTPVVDYTGPANFPIDQLSFTSSAFASPIGAEFAGMKWRIAEVTDPQTPGFDPFDRTSERQYEIDASWESEVLTPADSTVTIPGHRLQPGKLYRVRVRMQDHDNHWSHWSAPVQFTATAAVGTDLADSVRISEVNYNPYDPSAEERAAGFDDNNDFEFIELVNISDQTIDLTAASLDRLMIEGVESGVEFVFANGAITQLDPGARMVVVENLAAFQLRYGNDLPVAGEWSGRLGNASETITLSAFGRTIQQFTYQDDWHEMTDGGGATLDIVNPADTDLNRWNQAEAWTASDIRGGSPGRAPLAGIPGDVNHDGLFDSADLVAVLQFSEYEDGIVGNSTWEEGDWNGDGDFTTADLVFAFQIGAYADAAALRRLATPAVIDRIFEEQTPLLRGADNANASTKDFILTKTLA
jgi:hypothetical protein